jgi:hypothetical protein
MAPSNSVIARRFLPKQSPTRLAKGDRGEGHDILMREIAAAMVSLLSMNEFYVAGIEVQ